MKVLWVATYPELGPSTRYRISQFLPHLEARGVESMFLPLLSNDFYKIFYKPGRRLEKAAKLLRASAARLHDVVRARSFDVVVVQREAGLIGPPYFEYLTTHLARRPVVFDLDDAIFVSLSDTKQASTHPILSRLLKDFSKAERIARWATEVVVSSRHSAEWARRLNDRVTLIPTVVDGSIFRPDPAKNNAVPVVGWIGSPSAAPQLEAVFPALTRLAREHRFKLKLVGAGRSFEIPGVEVENLSWSLEREVDDFRSLDIGICPLFDDAWSRGKPGFKPLIYLACGVPQVTSPIGGVTDFVRDGDQGFFARNADEWYAGLKKLLESPELRATMGARARTSFEKGATLQTEVPKLHAVLERAVREPAQRALRLDPDVASRAR